MTLRYPRDMIVDEHTDYIKFDFWKYKPPLSRGGSGLSGYNQANKDAEGIDGNFGEKRGTEIHIYMPQDVSTSYATSWGGKELSNFGAGALSGYANVTNGNMGGAFDNLAQGIKGMARLPSTLLGEMTRMGLEQMQTSLTLNDVLSSTQGVILNPNVELFFSGHKIRNFGLKFKMSARTPEEAMDIISICNTFKVHSLPQFGGRDDSNAASTTGTGTSNFIKLPNLVKMEFMKGSDKHPLLSQYKAIALTNVDINYTPDGSYST